MYPYFCRKRKSSFQTSVNPPPYKFRIVANSLTSKSTEMIPTKSESQANLIIPSLLNYHEFINHLQTELNQQSIIKLQIRQEIFLCRNEIYQIRDKMFNSVSDIHKSKILLKELETKLATKIIIRQKCDIKIQEIKKQIVYYKN